MKKLTAFACALMLLLQAFPLTALAGGPPLSATEASAAAALAGFDAEADGSPGGSVSPSEMTGRELVRYLDGILNAQVHTLENYYVDLENTLARMRTDSPADYARLTSGADAGLEAETHALFRRTEKERLRIEHWRSRLDVQTFVIRNNLDLLKIENRSDYETRLSCRRIRDAVKEIREIRSEIAEDAGGIVEGMEDRIRAFAAAGDAGNQNGGSAAAEWAEEVLSEPDPVVVSAAVSASLFPTRKSLLASVSPISSAAADGSEMRLLVLEDTQNMIEVQDSGKKALSGARVRITDLRTEQNPKTVSDATDSSGRLIFANAGFQLKKDRILFSLEVSLDGYRTAVYDAVELKKGASLTVSLAKDTGMPYAAGCSFDLHECLYSSYEALFSTANDRVSPIRVTAVNPSDSPCAVLLMYQHENGKQYYRAMEVLKDGKKSGAYTVPAHSTAVLVSESDWRRRLKPGGAKFTLNADGKDVTDQKAASVKLVTVIGSAAPDGEKEGAPRVTAGTYTAQSSMLKVEKAKVMEPILNRNLMGSFFTKGLNFLNFNFPIGTDKMKPFLESGSVGLDLPFAKVIPRISVAIDGSTSAVIGTDIGEFTSKEGPLVNWKSADVKQIESCINEDDANSFFKSKLAKGFSQYVNMMDGGLKTGTVKGSVGLFASLTYKYMHNSKTDQWMGDALSGMLGVTLSLNVDCSYNFLAGPVPVTVGFTFTASATLAGMLGGVVNIDSGEDLSEELIQTSGLDPNFSGMTILIQAMITFYAGVGMKGIAAVTINGYGYLNFLFELKGNAFTHLKISTGIGVYLLFELLFIHAKIGLVDSPEWTIYEGSWPKADASRRKVFSSLFLSEARAEEPAEKAKALQATDYPDLVPESVREFGPLESFGANMRVIEAGGEIFLLYIAENQGENGKKRIVWRNLATGKTGTFADALKRAADRQRLIRDPEQRIPQNLLSMIDLQEAKFREENALLYGRDDFRFEVCRCEYDSGSAETMRQFFGEMFCLAAVNAETEGSAPEEIRLKGTPSLYQLMFRTDGDHGLTCDLPLPYVTDQKAYEPVVRHPSAAWTLLYAYPMQGSAEELTEALFSGISVSASFRRADEQTWYGVAAAASGSSLLAANFIPLRLRAAGSQDVMASSYAVNANLFRKEHQNIQLGAVPWYREGATFYSLDPAGEEGRFSLRYDSNYPTEIEAGPIPAYHVLAGAAEDTVFYLRTEETADGKVLHHLMAAKIQHFETPNTLPEYRFTDLDITVPGAAIRTARVGGSVYVYWIETATDPDDDSRRIYRLRGAVYDPASGISTDDFVLAQFTAPQDQQFGEFLFTDLGRGYYTMDGSVYSFPFQLKASLVLEDVILDKDVVGQGENDMVLLRMVNNGNMAVTSFTVEEYAEAIQANGGDQPVQTLQCYTAEPERNRLHLEGDDPELDIVGETACWREPLAMDNITQDYWEIRQTVRKFTSRTEYQDSEETVSLNATEILPGQVAGFNMMLKTPAAWAGTTHRLTVSLKEYSANVNQVRAMAARSGLSGANADPGGVLTYTRDGDGAMRADLAAAAFSGVTAGLYAAEAGASGSVTLDHRIDNLTVSDRVYRDAAGEERLSITLTNDASHQEPIRLYCEVLLDDEETPVYLDLPYDMYSTAHSRTHTIDLPLAALAGQRQAARARVTVRGIGITETTLKDNTFDVQLSDSDPLRITVQPQSRTVMAGESTAMTVQAAGGITPYTYRWQVWTGESLGWQEIQGADTDRLTLENIGYALNGRKYRCAVTDQNLDSVLSEEAVLTVIRELPPTGDGSQPLFAAAGAAVLALLWLALRRRNRGRERGR